MRLKKIGYVSVIVAVSGMSQATTLIDADWSSVEYQLVRSADLTNNNITNVVDSLLILGSETKSFADSVPWLEPCFIRHKLHQNLHNKGLRWIVGGESLV